MASFTGLFRQPQERSGERTQPLGSLRLDWLMALGSAWLIGGLFLDGWAHNHGRVDDSFFTPWHAVLYSGFLAIALLLGATQLANMLRGHGWMMAMPAGYELALLGAALFAFGGVGDMIWHILFGIEQNIEALLSPTHLLLAIGATLMLTAPLRAAWRRPGGDLPRLLPMLLSLALVLAVLMFFTQYVNPLVYTYADMAYGSRLQTVGVAGVLLQSALLAGVPLLLLRRWQLPFGSMIVLIALPAALLSVLDDQQRLVPAALLAGLLADTLIAALRPSEARPWALRLLGCALPAAYFALYFATLQLTGGIGWSVHLWAGAIVLAGITGLLLSFVASPPPVPAAAHQEHP